MSYFNITNIDSPEYNFADTIRYYANALKETFSNLSFYPRTRTQLAEDTSLISNRTLLQLSNSPAAEGLEKKFVQEIFPRIQSNLDQVKEQASQNNELVTYKPLEELMQLRNTNQAAHELFMSSVDRISELKVRSLYRCITLDLLSQIRKSMPSEQFIEFMNMNCAFLRGEQSDVLMIENDDKEPRVEEVIDAPSQGQVVEQTKDHSEYIYDEDSFGWTGTYDDWQTEASVEDQSEVRIDDRSKEINGEPVEVEVETEEEVQVEREREVEVQEGIQEEIQVEQQVERGAAQGLCGGATANPQLPLWVNTYYTGSLAGRQSVPKLLGELKFLEGSVNKLVTRETKLSEQNTYGMVFGLLNKSVGEYSRQLRNPTCNRTVSGTTVAKALRGLSQFSLPEQAKLYFASKNHKFTIRARQLNDMIKKSDIESLQDDLKWAVKGNFRNAKASEKNELRAMLSDSQRAALGIRAPRNNV